MAAVAGLVLAATTSWWLLVVGVAAIAAAWGYTGGPIPYGYVGLGEVFVFVFFGLVATVGTTYVAVERVTALAVVMGCAVGCLACALLVVNNLRDIPSDAVGGKAHAGRAHRGSAHEMVVRRARRRRVRARARRRAVAAVGAAGAGVGGAGSRPGRRRSGRAPAGRR